MRLLNTKSHTFKEFVDNEIPKYAILSHRWGDEEITFQECRKGKNRDSQGYAKVKRCCALAAERGLAWVWVDTCCIDKKSSAELSEAINSMYRWYHNAKKCYIYLSDVAWKSQDIKSSEALFTQSSWFTRGWTLQELIAPEIVGFFGQRMELFWDEEQLIEIDISCDRYGNDPNKMSWVSRRTTSRLEDMAYCMLGLFDVNMPLHYGEGAKAFMRLQLEIIKESDDESIFAWTSPRDTYGLLAPWPTCFAESGGINTRFPALKTKRSPYQMTNQGLQFEVPVTASRTRTIDGIPRDIDPNRVWLELNYWKKSDKGPLAVTVELNNEYGWHRFSCHKLGLGQWVGGSMSGSEKRDLQIIYQPRSSQGVLKHIDSPYGSLLIYPDRKEPSSQPFAISKPNRDHEKPETWKVAARTKSI